MNPNIKQRLAWLDNVKMVAILLVIIYHAGAIGKSYQLGPIIETFNMALFMILSGYTGLHKLDRINSSSKLIQYLKNIFLRIMVPCIFTGALLTPWTRDRLFFIHSFWFLQCIFTLLFTFSIAHYVICLFIKGDTFGFILELFIVNVILMFFVRNNISEMVPYFSVGLILRKYDIIDKLSYVRHRRLSLIAYGGIYLVTYHFYKSFYLFPCSFLVDRDLFPLYLARHISGISMSLLVIVLVRSISKEYNRFSYWGSKTLPLYTIHAGIIQVLTEYYNFKLTSTGCMVLDISKILLLSLILYLISISVINLAMRFKILRLLICGEK